MRGKELLECMEYIDDTLIEEALNPTIVSHKNKPVLKWSMAVACAATISAITFWSSFPAASAYTLSEKAEKV